MATIPAIVGALTGFGSLASLLAVSAVSSLLHLLGWQGLYAAGGMLALLSCAVLVPMALRPPAAARTTAKGGAATDAGEKQKRE